MQDTQLTRISNFICSVTDDVLRDVFVRGKYRDVILPMTVLRRLDAVLEPTNRWTTCIALAGISFLALIAAFVAVVRIFDVPLAGVRPEAFALTAMMTAPFTVGTVLVSTMAGTLVETLRRSKRPTSA